MTQFSLMSSKEIRKDGIYFVIKDSTTSETRNHPDLIDVFYISAVAISPNEQFFVFYERFNRNEHLFDGYGLNGVLSFLSHLVLKPSKNASPFNYKVSYNAHSLVANDNSGELHRTVSCTLFTGNYLKVETFINHPPDNWIETRDSDLYQFISFADIKKGLPAKDDTSFFPVSQKKKWWQF